jgi:hypothetical protein
MGQLHDLSFKQYENGDQEGDLCNSLCNSIVDIEYKDQKDLESQ